MTEVQSLHGTTVAEIFSAGLENLDQIDAIAVSVLWRDGTVTAGFSNTSQAIWRCWCWPWISTNGAASTPPAEAGGLPVWIWSKP